MHRFFNTHAPFFSHTLIQIIAFWQRMVLSIIVNVAYADKFDSQEEANAFVMQAQNFLICLEMLFSAGKSALVCFVVCCSVFNMKSLWSGYFI